MTKDLLKALVSIPSPSREEGAVADFIESFLSGKGIKVHRHGNNLWCLKGNGPGFLMDAHLDTVRPVDGWETDPFTPLEGNGRITGLGVSDDGGSVVAMITAFLEAAPRAHTLILSLSAEEEVSGKGGLEAALPEMGIGIEAGIIGEPTGLRMAVKEKGLMVLDCSVKGTAGHAGRGEGDNAIYKALKDIEWLRSQEGMQVTIINAGTQHNVVPDRCSFTVDVRTEGANEETLRRIRGNVSCEVTPRSTRLQGSSIPEEHPLVVAGKAIGLDSFSSSTLSNQALCPFPTVKIGPGDSSLSHTAGESIRIDEVERAVGIYLKLFESYEQIMGQGL